MIREIRAAASPDRMLPGVMPRDHSRIEEKIIFRA
jgi:hypothetical protein